MYSLAALSIFEAMKMRFGVSERLKIRKVLKIQRILKGFINRKKYKSLKAQIEVLSDPNQVSPLQLLKMLDSKNASLIQSFGAPFKVRFRLCDENAINEWN